MSDLLWGQSPLAHKASYWTQNNILFLCSLLQSYPKVSRIMEHTYQHLQGRASFQGSHTWLPGNEAILGGETPFQKTGWATVWLTHHRQLQRPWSGYTGWGCAPQWCNPAGSSPSLYTGSQRNRWSHVHHQSWLNENVGSHDNTWLQKVITGSKNSAKIKNTKIVMWVQVASFLGIPHL